MKSPFNLQQQNAQIESKLVVALERVSEAFRVLLWNESKANALSPIQNQILIFLRFHSGAFCTVSYLAQEFNMTKATISDSVKVLLTKGLVEKLNSSDDSRSYQIALTALGTQEADRVSQFALPVEMPLHRLSADQKQVMLQALLGLIRDLNQAGIITMQRMCFTCANYRLRENEHYCTLLQSTLEASALRLDCDEHLART